MVGRIEKKPPEGSQLGEEGSPPLRGRGSWWAGSKRRPLKDRSSAKKDLHGWAGPLLEHSRVRSRARARGAV